MAKDGTERQGGHDQQEPATEGTGLLGGHGRILDEWLYLRL